MFSRAYLWIAVGLSVLLPHLLVPQVLTRPVDDTVVAWLSQARRLTSPPSPPASLVIVAIDDRTLSRSPGSWPLGSKTIARIVGAITAHRPAAIGLAIPPILRSPSDDPSGDRELRAALTSCGRVVLRDPPSFTLMKATTSTSWPDDLVASAAGRGGGAWDVGPGRGVRAARLSQPSFHCQLIQVSQPLTYADIDSGSLSIRSSFVRELRISLRDGTSLDFELPPDGRIPTVSLCDLLEGKVRTDTLDRRIVLVGPTAPAIAPYLTCADGRPWPEVALDATVLENLLRGRYPPATHAVNLAILLLVLAGVATLGGSYGPVRRAKLAAGLLAIGLPSLAAAGHVALGVLPALLPWTLAGFGSALLLLGFRLVEDLLLSGRSPELIAAASGAVGRVAHRILDEADVLISGGQHRTAIDTIQRAMRIDPGVRQRALRLLLLCHLATQDVDLAEDEFKQLEIERLSLEDAYDLALKLAPAGHLEQSRVLLASVAEKESSFRDVKRQLEQVRKAQASRKDVVEELILKELRHDYEAIEPLRRGGMAVVYRAYMPELHRSVAIKILTPHLNNDTNVVHRFFLEAEALARFDSPHIVKVFRLEKEGPLKYYVMEHVHPSLSLRELIDREVKLPIPRATAIAKQLCRALEYVHERDVVHRDIKPQNILIADGDVLKLIDFGIARFEALSTMTSTGVVMGTPRYMSPEQIKGERVDYRTDVYATGVVLFEMLSGITGTENPTVERMRGGTTIHQLLLRQNLPIPLVKIVLKCIEVQRDRRYATVRDMRIDLEEFDRLPPGSYEL